MAHSDEGRICIQHFILISMSLPDSLWPRPWQGAIRHWHFTSILQRAGSKNHFLAADTQIGGACTCGYIRIIGLLVKRQMLGSAPWVRNSNLGCGKIQENAVFNKHFGWYQWSSPKCHHWLTVMEVIESLMCPPLYIEMLECMTLEFPFNFVTSFLRTS